MNSYSMIVAETSNELNLGHELFNENNKNQVSDDEIKAFLPIEI